MGMGWSTPGGTICTDRGWCTINCHEPHNPAGVFPSRYLDFCHTQRFSTFGHKSGWLGRSSPKTSLPVSLLLEINKATRRHEESMLPIFMLRPQLLVYAQWVHSYHSLGLRFEKGMYCLRPTGASPLQSSLTAFSMNAVFSTGSSIGTMLGPIVGHRLPREFCASKPACLEIGSSISKVLSLY